MKTALIDTTPINIRNRGAINLGLEIVKDMMEADVYHWKDNLSQKYDTIAFNVIYPMNLLNIAPFLKRNGIPILKEFRNYDPFIIVGGQGVGSNNILDKIVNSQFLGHYDHKYNLKTITTKPIINHIKKHILIEIARGCHGTCKFCEYRWTYGKTYREKPLDLIIDQIKELEQMDEPYNRITFLAPTFTDYSDLQGLLKYCQDHDLKIVNSNFGMKNMHIVNKYWDVMTNLPKISVESFDEATRKRIAKPLSDDKLWSIIKMILQNNNGISIRLIYGLPNDDYDQWFEWLERLQELRNQTDHRVKITFTIGNFEPCPRTPIDKEPVNFLLKESFIKAWIKALHKNGFTSTPNINYGNALGRFGMDEENYNMIMKLRNGGPELTEALIYALPNGVRRSVKKAHALRFNDYEPKLLRLQQ